MAPPPNSKRLRLWGTEHGSAVASHAAHYVSTGYGTKKTVQRQESLLTWARNDKARTALPAAMSNQVTQDTVRDRMRRNTHPRKGDKEQGGRRHLDPKDLPFGLQRAPTNLGVETFKTPFSLKRQTLPVTRYASEASCNARMAVD